MTSSTSATIPTTICILSDTHARPYKHELPESDILLHCGDLTNGGRQREYRTTLDLLGRSNAELKLVIAGNHGKIPAWSLFVDQYEQVIYDHLNHLTIRPLLMDFFADRSLDVEYWEYNRQGSDVDEDEAFSAHAKAVKFWQDASQHGITYLDEGVHEFNLKNGARLKVYVSPYTPEFCNWAFAYERNEDRFNKEDYVMKGSKSIAQTPIPDFPEVDIVMTHGPPMHRLDRTTRGQNVGCLHLLQAVERARPRIHCFGHIHEAHGAEKVHWASGKHGISSVATVEYDKEQVEGDALANIDISSSGSDRLVHGETTLMVNAAQMTMRGALRQPWLVRVDLPAIT